MQFSDSLASIVKRDNTIGPKLHDNSISIVDFWAYVGVKNALGTYDVFSDASKANLVNAMNDRFPDINIIDTA